MLTNLSTEVRTLSLENISKNYMSDFIESAEDSGTVNENSGSQVSVKQVAFFKA
jgi:hypothetical protein